MLWSLQRETGFTHDYLMWGEPWMQLNIKLSDAPRYISKKKSDEAKDISHLNEEEQEKAMMDFFQKNK